MSATGRRVPSLERRGPLLGGPTSKVYNLTFHYAHAPLSPATPRTSRYLSSYPQHSCQIVNGVKCRWRQAFWQAGGWISNVDHSRAYCALFGTACLPIGSRLRLGGPLCPGVRKGERFKHPPAWTALFLHRQTTARRRRFRFARCQAAGTPGSFKGPVEPLSPAVV